MKLMITLTSPFSYSSSISGTNILISTLFSLISVEDSYTNDIMI